MAKIPELGRLKVPLEDIRLATNYFAEQIGWGGFGIIYKGQLPPRPRTINSGDDEPTEQVAVKRLINSNNISGQGNREFVKELVMLASYKHNNLASLIGFCDEDNEKILIFKYEVNGSLDKHVANTDVTWEQRLRICLGAALGLEYLHNGVGKGHRVLHRDIKSSNILLDANWVAKISDFGLSKIGPTNQEFTFLVTDNAAGTYGYIDPQYTQTGVLTKESDVYSFGVVLFEVLCGRLAMVAEYHDERRFLFTLAQIRYEQGKLEEIIMDGLRDQINSYSLQTFSKVAYRCLDMDRRKRPKIEEIVHELETSLEFQTGSPKVIRSGFWGSSTGGDAWWLKLDGNQKVRKITIDHEDWIFSIGFSIQELTGSLISSQHGGTNGPSGGQLSQIDFDDEEEIIEILGTVGVTSERCASLVVISSVCFITNKATHGPFGQAQGGSPFSIQWNVGLFGGFYGRAGFYLDGLGFYSKINI